MFVALCERFDDHDEMRDVATYGCAAGVSGFIYSTELREFFLDHEDEIEDVMHDCGLTLTDLVHDDEDEWTFQQLRERAVWFVVETYCAQRTDEVLV